MINSGHAFLIEAFDINLAQKEGKELVKQLLCENKNNCNDCLECKLIDSTENPNVIYVDGYKGSIKSEHMLMVKEYTSTLNVTGKKFIILIDGIENATPKAANSILKFVEEPRGDIFFIFTTLNKESVLPTIQSRAQFIKSNSQEIILEENDWIRALISNAPFEINWSQVSKQELKNMLLTVSRQVRTNGNEEFLKKVLELINMLDINVNKNIVVTQLIEAIKNRRI